MTDARITDMIAWAKSQVGYREGYANGHWDNQEKYVNDPGMADLAWAQGQPWCSVFTSDAAIHGGLQAYYPHTASVPAAHQWFTQHGYVSDYPAIGAWLMFGTDQHVGLVVAYDATTVTTVEGNTNTDGSPEGNGVYLKTHQRTDPWVAHYGYPNIPGVVLQSADPAYNAAHAPRPVTLLDCAFDFRADTMTRADVQALIDVMNRDGHAGLIGYASRFPQKNLPKWAADMIRAAGKVVGLCFEDGQGNPTGGTAQGTADAKVAIAWAQAIGLPKGMWLATAYDKNSYLMNGTDLEYGRAFTAEAHAASYKSMGYGDDAVVHAGVFDYVWHVQTWGTDNTHVNLMQMVNHPINPVTSPFNCDVNQVIIPLPMWSGTVIAPAAKPAVAPAPDANVAQLKHQAALVGAHYPPGTPRGDFARKVLAAGRGIN